jgi:subtilisin family serine protease
LKYSTDERHSLHLDLIDYGFFGSLSNGHKANESESFVLKKTVAMRYSGNAVIYSTTLLGLAHVATSVAPKPPLERKLQKLAPEQLSEILIPKQDQQVVPETVDVDADLFGAQGQQEVIIRFKTPPVAAMAGSMTKAECKAHKQSLKSEHASFMQECGALSAQEMGSLTILLNPLFLKVDAEEIEALTLHTNVLSIHRVADFEKSLDRRVPYIGDTAVQQDYGFNGTGINIAILDSCIDYTHADLGGKGTAEAWDAPYKDFTARDGLFPTEKVVEGFDFVGELWPEGDLLPDDDPIDIDGHGTHCADIAAGVIGVAPGASLYAVKVCSALSSRCSGVALLQGMEYAIDPDGDGDTSE